MSRYDVIVVGVGGVGSAATYHLARRGLDVLGIERFDVPHSMGSSHGMTRIARLAHADPEKVALARRAYERWRALEQRRDEQLLYVTGSLSIGHGDDEAVRETRRACEERGVDHELLGGDEVTGRFPAWELPAEYGAVWQPDGGFLASERCIVAHVEEAQALGAEVHAREQVTGWTTTGDGVAVETDRGEYEAGSLVVTAGAWAAELVDALDGRLTVSRHVDAWFQPRTPDAFGPGEFPVFSMTTYDGGFYYGTPVHGVPGVKVGGPATDPEVDPDGVDRTPTRDAEAPLRSFAERYLPDGAGPTMRLETGLVTWSPDGEFVLDTLPDRPNVVVGAGFSGHGYKFASVLGEILADLAVDGTTAHDVERFRLDRFA